MFDSINIFEVLNLEDIKLIMPENRGHTAASELVLDKHFQKGEKLLFNIIIPYFLSL